MLSCNGCKNRNTSACRNCVGWNRYESNTLINTELAIDIDKEMKLIEKRMLNIERKNYMNIKKVIFNAPATIVIWNDGTKTIVKSGDYDVYDPEKGLAMAIAKKALGNEGNYYNVFKEWVPEEIERKNRIDASAIVMDRRGTFSSCVSFDISKEDFKGDAQHIADIIVGKLKRNNPNIISDILDADGEAVENNQVKTEMLSPEKLAEKLGCTVGTVQRRCRKGYYPGAVKVGGKWKIPY